MVLVVAIGAFVVTAGFTFVYARGLSYLSTDPRACANCHIMQRQYDAWGRSSHESVAVCVDCHLPHAFVAKYAAKLENGWRHGQKFTTQNFQEPISVQARGREILQENCVRCHEHMVDDILAAPNAHGEAASCVHCHAGVGHGETARLGGPMRSEELEQPEKEREKR